MKALSLTQPWASLVVRGVKKIETRSWSTTYRGRVLIHASKAMPSWAKEFAADHDVYIGPEQRGAIVGAANIDDVVPTEQLEFLTPLERELGDFTPGRFAWLLSGPTVLDRPIVATGRLGLWEYRLTESLLRWRDIGRPEPAPARLDRLEASGHARNGFCERCWSDAYTEAMDTGRPQADVYLERLAAAEALA